MEGRQKKPFKDRKLMKRGEGGWKRRLFNMSTNSEKNMSLNHAMIDWIKHRQNILSEKNG